MRYTNIQAILLLYAGIAALSPAAVVVVKAQSYFQGSKCPKPQKNDKKCRCISVRDYDDLRRAVLRMDDDGECKCFEPFSVTKADYQPSIDIVNKRRNTIICQEVGQCEIHGVGTHFRIGGEESEVTISGFRFLGATESAIIVLEGTGTDKEKTREQTFCDNEFINNENAWYDGGAISIGPRSRAYIANSYFEHNIAARMGGAVSAEASMIQVLDSTFKSNWASLGGAISSNKPESTLVLSDNEFDGNRAGLGPTYGPAVAANGEVQDFGGNAADPRDFMCLSCKLIAGIEQLIEEAEQKDENEVDILNYADNGDDDDDDDDDEEEDRYKRNPEFEDYDEYDNDEEWGPFNIKLYFGKGYQWQEQYKDLNMCIQSKYPEDKVRGKDEPSEMYKCDDDNDRQRFYAVGKTIRLAEDRNLCMTYVDSRGIAFHQCNGSIWQDWDRVQQDGKFKISPFTDHRRCATNHHHPRNGERVYLEWCNIAEEGDTVYWILKSNDSD